MLRTFAYSFDPPASCPLGGYATELELDVAAIEDAGVREVLQTPGTAYGSWSILDALLTPTGPGSPLVFREPLGQAREVKTALSGLFGRFVARAYLERHFDLAIFAHLSRSSMTLNGQAGIQAVKLTSGDLPDWLASTANLSTLTVAEAKGCHDRGGPAKPLLRAWNQAGRIDVQVNGKKVGIKRIAIATRWGAASGGPANPQISVRDPDEVGETISSEEQDALYIGILRRHIANLIDPLGHHELANVLRQLTNTRLPRVAERNRNRARQLLDSSPIKEVIDGDHIDGLIGGVVTRAGPVATSDVSPVDQNTLARLSLRPLFVGIERDLLNAALDGEAAAIRKRLDDKERRDEIGRPDRAGGWIIPLGEGQRFIKDP